MSRHKKPRPASEIKPLLDIVITSGGRFDMLAKCLDTVSSFKLPINLWLIDNASDAEERLANEEIFTKEYSWLNAGQKWYKRLTQSQGFPASNNEGARMGSAPLIMFLNDDVQLLSGAIEKVLQDFLDPKMGIVGIKLLFPEDSTSPIRPAGKVQHVGIALNVRGEPVHVLVGWSKDNPKTCVTRDVWAVTGACLTVRRELFNKVGGFDVVYGEGTYEDLDLCLRIRQLGFRIICNTNAIGYHYTGATQEKKKKNFPLQENLLKFRSRWQATGLMSWTEWEYW